MLVSLQLVRIALRIKMIGYLTLPVFIILLGACTPSAQRQEDPHPSPIGVTAAETKNERATAAATAAIAPPATQPATATPASTSTLVPSTAEPATATPEPQILTFAVIGDYGTTGPGTQAVASLVNEWDPDLLLTVGDNNYPDGSAQTIAGNITDHYGRFIAGDRFFPTLGNHDLNTDFGQPYLDYFDLPGNERYYEFVRGDVHFFALNSDWREPDGIGSASRQAEWLRQALASSTTTWQVVYFHAPPYVSMEAKQVPALRWPFAQWGADLVLSGHAHLYERLRIDGIPYLVNGLGGAGIYLFDESILPDSQFRFNGNYGALLIEATSHQLTARFVTHTGTVVDQLTQSR